GLTLRKEGGAGMVAGSWRAAEAMAEFTSCAAASMTRSRENCMVMRETPWPLTEVISSMPEMVESCRSSTVATAEDMVSGLAPGSSRSEERRVGKECRSRWARDQDKKKEKGEKM